MLFFSLIFLILLLGCPETAMAGSRYGVTLWLTQLIPTLLPFFISIGLLRACLPRVSSRRGFLLLGLLCGYPAGAALVSGQYSQGLLTERQAFFYLGFVNNPSPMFTLVFCGRSALELSPAEGFLLFGVTVLSAFLGSLLFSRIYFRHSRRKSKKLSHTAVCSPTRKSEKKHAVAASSTNTVASADTNASMDANTSMDAVVSIQGFALRLDAIIADSFAILLKIGGYVTIFSIIGQFVHALLPPESAAAVLCAGALEITCGVSYLPRAALSLEAKKVLAAGLLAFGGLSAAAQTGSVILQSELSLVPYILNKALNSLLAGTLSFLLFRVL